MRPSTFKVAALLFGSGACSLVYETVWLRELRLVFGASTMASAAVVACFIGGLGAGGLIFGKRADAHRRPLAMYAMLEAGIAASAAVTPLLLVLVRAAYIAVGGTRTLGAVGGSVVRLALAALVFALPTVMMGGTLPAVARAVEADDDHGRRDLALLYGVNTLGAVTGCLASTFVLFEALGTRMTLVVACLVNALVAVTARSLSRTLPVPSRVAPRGTPDASSPNEGPAWFTLTAAGVAGFVFCLMELVWYRMLGPLLGGTVFTFGLILAMALLGIGFGGLAYGALSRGRAATMRGFAWTCLLEAACVAIPFALGDRLAILAALLRPVGGLSFAMRVAEWSLVTFVVVVPAAFMSGVQFPLLVGLLGRGDEHVGRDVGRTYATNTLGAIAGSLAGGFGLIPALSATGCWRAVVWLLLGLGGAALVLAARRRLSFASLAPAIVGVLALLCIRAIGPTAAWRHSAIGAGRADASLLTSTNGVRAWEHDRRRAIDWEVDGRESSVAIDSSGGVAFVVSGKVDGSARGDAGTGIMMGIVGAMLHPKPTRAMVIGLGTGESAGWLAAIDTITDVDVAELEPAILEVARRCEIASHGALENPKLHVEIGDARELLLTSKRRYDLIASEPSNPYRAGVASLFTKDYYEAIRSRLEQGGLFLQWLQGYEVDAQTVRTVQATVASVFAEVETWELTNGDMLLVASSLPIEHDVARMRARAAEEPYKSALERAWRVSDLEGFLSHFIASSALTRKVAAEEHDHLNTDDANVVEFGFARSVGTGAIDFGIGDVRRVARTRHEDRPRLTGGDVDWVRVDDGLAEFYFGEEMPMEGLRASSPEDAHRLAALRAFRDGNPQRVVTEWRAQSRPPSGSIENVLLGTALAELRDDAALPYAESLRATEPGDADAIVARLRLRQERFEEAATALESFFVRLRADPWPMPHAVRSALEHAKEIAAHDPRLAPRLFAALREPFALRIADDARKLAALAVSALLPGAACADALAALEPNVPWNEPFLVARYECYRAAKDPRADEAAEDVVTWRSERAMPFDVGLTGAP